MLFKVLKIFGLDVRAEIAVVKDQIEQRVDEVVDRVRHATLVAAVVVALSTFAGLLCTMAMGVGLFALYRTEAASYGVGTALAVVAAVLVVAALILLGIALMVAKSSSRVRASKAAQDVAGSAAAAPATASAPPQAGDLTEPLAFLLALFARTRSSDILRWTSSSVSYAHRRAARPTRPWRRHSISSATATAPSFSS